MRTADRVHTHIFFQMMRALTRQKSVVHFGFALSRRVQQMNGQHFEFSLYTRRPLMRTSEAGFLN